MTDRKSEIQRRDHENTKETKHEKERIFEILGLISCFLSFVFS